MTGGAEKRTLRRTLWWSAGSRVSLVLVVVLALCASAGIRVAAPVRLAVAAIRARVPVLQTTPSS